MQTPAEVNILDVVEEFSCPNQSEAYQEAYRSWRRRKKNRYAFRFSKNPKEAAFSENQSVVNATPAQAEQSALHALSVLLGCALIVYLVIENLVDKLVILVGNRFGLRVETMYWGESRYFGDDLTVFLFTAALQMLKILVPTLIIGLALRMPTRISVPLRVRNKGQLLCGVCLMMLLSVGVGIALVSRSAELAKYQLITQAQQSQDNWSMLYLLFTIFAAPLFWELLFHGCIFQALRQFGDWFAIGTVTVLAALLTHDVHDALRIGLVTLTISYFMVKTGSFLTAVLLRIIHEIYMFALFQIESVGGIYSLQWWVVVLFPCLVGLLTLLVLVLRGHEYERTPRRNPAYMSTWDQATTFFTTMPMVTGLVSCVLLFVVMVMLG